MLPNPILNKLGFGDRDRLVIIHADDVGMCQASLAAYRDLVDFGLVSAASTMVPCSWFPAVAQVCREYKGAGVDMGVHITLTSEFDDYRWGPISTRDPSSGLLDRAGFFHASTDSVRANADPAAVQQEIRAQVMCALDGGIDVTHIDTHMGSVIDPRFLPAYLQVALEHRVPPFLLRADEAGLRELGIDAETAAMFVHQLGALESAGIPLLDDLKILPLEQPDDRLEQVRNILQALSAGMTYLIVHPAKDTPELRAITPDWRGRVADFQAFASDAMAKLIRDAGVHIIGWRVLRDLMREGSTSGA